ncbi:hypothetical protein J7E93_15680 [Streptomyces sp. ISL-36]|uniref:hypothetical protein n=1 Tax=Streptomyces sp. ISL-36 TaxID=2819182 RepID=UPI001BED1692|nr:hypothetical protein [Streptomyces sp. ISL-36]MBT2441529.1 hypothetical protein [Streptomyces sp. ISL-36]
MATPERAEERISMSDLLASCAAASAVSTPPREREPAEDEPDADQEGPVQREAA